MPAFNQYLREIRLNRDKVPSFDRYPFSIPAIRNLDRLELHPKVTYLIGENGSGKSTLLEAMAVAFGLNPEGGSRNFNFATRESHSELHDSLSLIKGIRRPNDTFFLRAESLYNVATEVDNLQVSGYGDRSLHDQSHGESFWTLLSVRLRGKGLYLFDEPEAALSPSRQLAALRRIHDLVRADSQFVIATHSPILMAYPDSRIFQLADDSIRQVEYEETDHLRITRAFLNHTRLTLEELFEKD